MTLETSLPRKVTSEPASQRYLIPSREMRYLKHGGSLSFQTRSRPGVSDKGESCRCPQRSFVTELECHPGRERGSCRAYNR